MPENTPPEQASPQTATTWRAAFQAAFPHTIPIFTGYMVLGMAFGVLMATKGYGPLWSFFISLITYAGSMEYLEISLLTAPFAPIQSFILGVTVNARHLFYGLSMLKRYSGLGKLKAFLIFALTDETYSVICTIQPPEGMERKKFYVSLSLLDYSYWVLASTLGGVIGSLLTFDTTGLDFVLTALFVVLFIEQVTAKENRLPGFIGLFCTVLVVVLVPVDNIIIPAMILILAVLLAGRRKLCR